MPDPATATETEKPAEGNRSETEQNSQPATNPELEQLKAKYNELETFAKGAVQRAERADSFVAQMTDSLRVAAEASANRPDPNNPGPSLQERFAEDPMGVLDAHFQARTAPIVASVAENNARINRSVAFQRFETQKIPGTEKTYAEVYGKEVDEFMKDIPAAQRAQEGSWEAALQWVRSKRVDDEVKMRMEAVKESEKRTFMEGSSSVTESRAPAKALSDVERQVAKGLGLSEDEYKTFRDNPSGA